MSKANSQLRTFAQRLIALEAKKPAAPGAKLSPEFRVCEKLRPHLARLMGIGGFRVLLSRALVLAGAEVRWLRAVHVKADGGLEGFAELQTQLTAGEISEGRVVLVAQLLGLLVAFIGEHLTLRLMQDAWPELSPGDWNLGKGDEK
jgi:hypothetical protein